MSISDDQLHALTMKAYTMGLAHGTNGLSGGTSEEIPPIELRVVHVTKILNEFKMLWYNSL